MDWVSKVVDVVTAKRIWLFAAIALGSGLLIVLPDVGPLQFSAVRKIYSTYLTLALVAFGSLFVVSVISNLLEWVRKHVRQPAAGLMVTTLDDQSYWQVRTNKDGSVHTYIRIVARVYNPSAGRVEITKTTLERPLWSKVEPTMAQTDVQPFGLPDQGHAPPIPFRATRTMTVNIAVPAAIGGMGQVLKLVVRLHDQTGQVHPFRARIKRSI